MNDTELIRQLAERSLKGKIKFVRKMDCYCYDDDEDFWTPVELDWTLVGVIFDTVAGWDKEKRDAFDDALYQLFLTPEGLIEPRRINPRIVAEALLSCLNLLAGLND